MTEAAIPVIDFRRSRMTLRWHPEDGTWDAYDEAPALVHGVALIRPTGQNFCLYGHAGSLVLQAGAQQFTFAAGEPRLSCARTWSSVGLRREFRIRGGAAGEPLRYSYWAHPLPDFLVWLAARAADPQWSQETGQRWTEGLSDGALRAAVSPRVPPG